MGDPAAAASGMSSILMLVLMFVVMYFIIIRPQKKRDKLMKEMLAGLMVGDKIVTIGGIYGKIVSLKDDTLVLDVSTNNEPSTMKIARWAVKEIVKPVEA